MAKSKEQMPPAPVPRELAGTVNDPRGPGFVLRDLGNGQKQFGVVTPGSRGPEWEQIRADHPEVQL